MNSRVYGAMQNDRSIATADVLHTMYEMTGLYFPFQYHCNSIPVVYNRATRTTIRSKNSAE